MEKPDFSKIFASNSALSAYTFSDADYLTGWSFIGSTPPARTMFDAWMRQSDTKMKWLHDNALYDSSLEDVLFWRMPLTTYAAGARRCLRNGPLGVYLLCIIDGTTDANVLSTLPTGTEVGKTFTDGSVTWQVMQHASTAALSEHVSANDAHAALFAKMQPLNANLSALAGMKTAADKLIYTDEEDSFALATLTEFARSLLATTSAPAARNTLGAAPLSSPDFLGTPTAPTPAVGTKTTQIATTAFVAAAISALVNSSPAALDTLSELAAALGNDSNFAATMTNALAGKLSTNASCNKNWNWAGQSGQPSWLWGGENGSDMYVYNPQNFHVSYADSAGSAGNSNQLGGSTLAQVLAQINAGNTGGIIAASFGANGYVKWSNGFILQWGIGGTSSGWGSKTTFSISFQVAPTSIFITPRNPKWSSEDAVYAEGVGIRYADTTGFYGGLANTTANNNFFWLATGR